MNKADVLKIQEARRKLLRNLNILYPSPIRIGSLWRTVCHTDPIYDFSLFAKDINYFFDKHWILYVDDEIGGADSFKDKVIKLTDKGKEVAEGTITDPALGIE